VDILPAQKLRQLDDRAKELGLSERLLIENASSNLFEKVDKLSLGKKVLVVAGRGNNGADVLSCARKLYSRGYCVTVVVLEQKPLGEEAYFQKNILEKIKVPVYSISASNVRELKLFLQECDFVLEGIVGIGVKGTLDSFLLEVINLINGAGKRIVSCDVPSGLCPQEGVSLGGAIKADYTVSFIAAKPGFFKNEGIKLCGEIFVVDIGISKKILEDL